jgi:hypothetical protein
MINIVSIKTILEICRERGIILRVAGEKLVIDGPEKAVTADLLTELRQHKTHLLSLLKNGVEQRDAKSCEKNTGTLNSETPEIAPSDEPTVPPSPCSRCGGLLAWWDVLGGFHCMTCEIPQYSWEKAHELRQMAQQLRQFPRKISSLRPAR